MRRFLRSASTAIPLCIVLLSGGWAEAAPTEPSIVKVNARQLVVQRRLPDGTLAAPAPYVIKGINWSPGTAAPRFGPDPTLGGAQVPYGFFFDGPWRTGLQGSELMNVWLKQEIQNRYAADIPLMAQMNVNTVRIYLDFGAPPAVYQQILDTFYNNGIMVILSVVNYKSDIDTASYLTTVGICKNHPAILMWSIGNEWNLNVPPMYGYSDMGAAIAAVNQAVAAIKAADPNHPVTSSLGDRFVPQPDIGCGFPDYPLSDIPAVVSRMPSIDIWGLNVFRGASFGNLFTQWQALTTKPFYLSEFGTDSFQTTAHTLPFYNPPCEPDPRGLVSAGAENQTTQATVFTSLWNEIAGHLSAVDPANNCVGGVVYEFNDEIWKVGDFNVHLGKLVDYDGPDKIPGNNDDDISYGTYNPDGFFVDQGHPDNFANEEYFGVVTADRQPKAAFAAIKSAYGGAPNVTLTKSVDKTAAASGTIVTYSIQYLNTGLGDARNFVLRDVLPVGVALVPGSISGGGVVSGVTIQWSIGTVPGAASGVVSFQVRVL